MFDYRQNRILVIQILPITSLIFNNPLNNHLLPKKFPFFTAKVPKIVHHNVYN